MLGRLRGLGSLRRGTFSSSRFLRGRVRILLLFVPVLYSVSKLQTPPNYTLSLTVYKIRMAVLAANCVGH